MSDFAGDLSAVLDDLVVLAFVIAHGTDADLDAREVSTLHAQVGPLALGLADRPLSAGDVAALFDRAAGRYRHSSVADVDAAVARLAASLDAEARARAFEVLVAVADADGELRTMERTVLSHIRHAWGL